MPNGVYAGRMEYFCTMKTNNLIAMNTLIIALLCLFACAFVVRISDRKRIRDERLEDAKNELTRWKEVLP